MQINIRDIWGYSARKAHKEYVANAVLRVKNKSSLMQEFLTLYGTRIATATPPRLREIIGFVESLRFSIDDSQFSSFLAECKSIFDYAKFSSKATEGWNAYSLCKLSKYRMCPYCQHASAFTLQRDSDKKGYRPTLDHYYPKGEYPYLSLSLYNLVPSCYSCNSSLKGQANFYLDKHLHPFEHDEIIRYEWDIHSYLSARQNSNAAGGESFSAGVKVRDISSHAPYFHASRRTLDTFLIAERLEISVEMLRSFFEVLLTISPSRLAYINKEILGQTNEKITEESALQFSRKNYKNEWFGRLKADLLDAAWTHHQHGGNIIQATGRTSVVGGDIDHA